MTFRDKVYTLREENARSVTKYFISFTDGQGTFHDLEVSDTLYIEFKQLERTNRNLQQSDERHREYSELTEETLNRRARFTPKSVDEFILEAERSEFFQQVIANLPDIQRRRFILYYKCDCTFYEIGAMENCTAQAARRSVIIAKEKVKAQMEQYFCV